MYNKNYFYYKRIRRKKYKKKLKIKKNIPDIFLILLLILILSLVINFIYKNKKLNVENISYFNMTYPNFLYLNDLSKKYKLDFNEVLSCYFIEENFFKYKKKFISKKEIENDFFINYKKIKKRHKKYTKSYKYVFDTLFKEIEFFPISYNNKNNSYIYLNSYEKNLNSGINIIDRENSDGSIKVISMTDGIVNKKVLMKNQKFKIEVVTQNNTYYMYSNLYKISDNIKIGSFIKSGDLLGYIRKNEYYNINNENNYKYLNISILINWKNIKGQYFINPYIFLRNIENTKN